MRGSRPGERRGGRKKGTPNKKTAYVRAVMAAHAASPNATPMDVMLAVMRHPYVALEMRVKMGLKALPHLHRKLRAGDSASVAGDGPLPIGRRQKLSPRAQRGNEPSLENSVNEAAEMMRDGATPTKGEESRSVVAASLASADVPSQRWRNPQRRPNAAAVLAWGFK